MLFFLVVLSTLALAACSQDGARESGLSEPVRQASPPPAPAPTLPLLAVLAAVLLAGALLLRRN